MQQTYICPWLQNFYVTLLGTNGDEESSAYIQQFAVYIANLFFLTSDTQAIIVKDDELDDSLAGTFLYGLGDS